MHRRLRWLNPTSSADGFNHLRWNHGFVQMDWFAEFDELIGSEVFSASEMKADRNQVRKRQIVGFCQCSCGEHRSDRPGFESNHVRLAVARAFGKQHAAEPVGDPA